MFSLVMKFAPEVKLKSTNAAELMDTTMVDFVPIKMQSVHCSSKPVDIFVD